METNSGPLARNIKRLSRMDIPGGGQIVVQGRYAYIGHIAPPYGTSIVDISDPKKPRLLSQIMLPGSDSHTHKVRVVGDDLMIVNSERHNRHFFRKGLRIPQVRVELERAIGRVPTDPEIARHLNIKTTDIPLLLKAAEVPYRQGGFRVYDISDRTAPREIAFQITGGYGVHRFDVDEHYVYVSTEMNGFNGNILVIYDIRAPENPVEVSRWWVESQKIPAGNEPVWINHSVRLHHAMRCGNQLWAACCGAGFYIVDIADIAAPQTIGAYNYHPPIRAATTHTALRVPFPIDGREIALVIDEQHAQERGQPPAFMWVFDVSDLSRITPLSTFHVSELDSPWCRSPGARFGAHQFQEHMRTTLVYATWFCGGLRVVDIADPFLPKETAFFIPEPGKGATVPMSNDVDVDERGLIYLLDRINGMDILEMEN